MQPTFSERNWHTRKNGDFFYHSETMFEQHWPGPYARYGLGPQTEHMATWATGKFISHTPDYLASLETASPPFLVEVQGTGNGGANETGERTHKFKESKLSALERWNKHLETTFWLWDDADKTYIWTSYASITLMVARGLGTVGTFDGKRPYWAIPVTAIAKHCDTQRLKTKYK